MVRIGWIIAAVLVVFAASARGQQIRDISGPFGIPVMSTSVEKYATMMGLDNDQKQLVRTLYQGYRAAFRHAMTGGDKELESLNKQGDQPGDRDQRMNRGMEMLQKFAADAAKVEDEFFSDFRAILKPEQVTMFPRVERARRRDVQMRFAFVSGEGVDILSVLEQVKVKPEGEIAAVCDEYEAALDHLMLEKQRVMKASLGKANKIQKNGLPDFELVGQIIGDLYAIGGRIRDCNRQYARRLEPMLPEARQPEFNTEFKKRSYPRVYAPTLAHRCLEAANGLDGLTQDQVAQIKSIGDTYKRDLEAANQRYAAAIESTQERFPKDFLVILQSRFDPNKDDPLTKAREERSELNQAVFSKLKSLLKAEQFQKLPQADRGEDGFPEFLPDLRNRSTWESWDNEEQ